MSKKAQPQYRNTPKYLHVAVSDEEVTSSDRRAIALVAALPANSAVCLSFFGYEDDPRSVWEIPEVVAYIRQALAKYPTFIARLDLESQRVIRFCICWDTSTVAVDGNRVVNPMAFDEQGEFVLTRNVSSRTS